MERRQIGLGLVGYMLVGTGAVLVPSLMPAIIDEFAALGLTLAAIGALTPAGGVGRIAGILISGWGSDRLGRQRLVWLSALLLAVALALTASARPWALFMLGYVAVTLTQGALSTSINAMVADAASNARARALNVLHGTYGLGAAISPLAIGALLAGGLPWRQAIAGTGALWLLYGLVALWLARGEAPAKADGARQKASLQLLQQGPVLALFAVAFIYNGVASSLLTWVAVLGQQIGGLSTFLAVSMVSVFYIALTAGRFACAALAERLGYGRTFWALSIGLAVTYPLAVWGGHSLLVAAGILGTGLSLSGLFPTALAEGARRYPGQIGAITSTLTVALTLGSMIPPLWTALLVERMGLQPALSLNYAMAVALIALALYLRRGDRPARY